MKIYRKKWFWITLLVAILIVVYIVKPSDKGKPHQSYFADINSELRAHKVALPGIFVDLDRVDHISQVYDQKTQTEK